MIRQEIERKIDNEGVTQGYLIRQIEKKTGERIDRGEFSNIIRGKQGRHDTPKGIRILKLCEEILNKQ